MENQQGLLQYEIYNDNLKLENLNYAKTKFNTKIEFDNFVFNMDLGIKDHCKVTGLSEAVTKKIRREIIAEYKKQPLPAGFHKVTGYKNPKGNYAVNKNGTIINTDLRNILATHLDHKGYVITNITYTNDYGNEMKKDRVHRVVAKTFIPNPENKPQVNHIDGNKQNNDVSNLEWVTNDENMSHAIKTGLRENAIVKISGENSVFAKLTNAEADAIRSEYANGDTSSIKLGKKYKLSKPCVLRIIHNKSYCNRSSTTSSKERT